MMDAIIKSSWKRTWRLTQSKRDRIAQAKVNQCGECVTYSSGFATYDGQFNEQPFDGSLFRLSASATNYAVCEQTRRVILIG